MVERRLTAFAVLLLIDFAITVVMLVTDKNLQTDFGGSSPYYLHWYAGLGMGILDLVVAGVLLLLPGTASPGKSVAAAHRGLVLAAVTWPVLAVLALVGVVATYQQVGFQNAMQFAQYLFGVTAYPGVLAYIPWLYDVLVVMYILTAIVGATVALQTRQGSVQQGSAA